MRQVSNPYKEAIRREWNYSRFDIDRLGGLLSQALLLLPQAWAGGASDDVYQELSDMQTDAKTVSDDVDDKFDWAWRRQPTMVDENAWQVTWRHMTR